MKLQFFKKFVDGINALQCSLHHQLPVFQKPERAEWEGWGNRAAVLVCGKKVSSATPLLGAALCDCYGDGNGLRKGAVKALTSWE